MNLRFLAFTLCILKCTAGVAAEFFVAPNGNDSNPGTRSRPFRSFEQAQQAVRARRAARPDSGVTVTFQAGTYVLAHALEFTAADSGASAQQPVLYRAKPGASVVISGGRVISGWVADPEHPGAWKARAGDPTTPGGHGRF